MTVQTRIDLLPVERAFAGMAQDFADACQDTFDDPVWAWPATTRRRNGQQVGSPRNLIDLGELQGSQQPPVVHGLNATIDWTADHAAAVFLGAVYRKRAYSLPARNLPQYVARHFDWQASFTKHFK